ncbi:choice-of-anchor U domain-containing protein, partial [Candidatus Halobeggiatoa sp. HSG11]|nr:choice-of-anchor U domain-containing protein [Candidatus Halobeggiatoa sp. HSG11]
MDISSLPESTESYSFPESLVTFELEATETAHLDVYYKYITNLDNFVYRKYGPTIPGDNDTDSWYNFSNATFELADINNLTGIVKVSLTLNDGQIGDDTGIDGIIIDDGGIATPEPTLEDTTTKPPEVTTTTGLPDNCSVRDDSNIISTICNVEQQVFPEKVEIISDISSISNAIFEDDVINAGMIANSIVGEEATLSGGFLSGNINNEGIIKDIKFVGNELSGGTLSGHVINESQVGGVITDVELAAGTVLKGGKIGGTIIGEPNVPPVITAAEILPGAILSNVHLSPTVTISDDVILKEGVTIATEPYQPEDFGLNAEDIANLTPELLSELEPEALATFTAEDVALIPPEALSELQAVQIATMKGLEGLTIEQFAEIP